MFHTHHVVPKHVGGTDDPSNKIILTVEQHAEAHRVLWEDCGRKEDWIAWKCLGGQAKHPEVLHEIARLGGLSHLGEKYSDEHKQNISKGLSGKPKSLEARKRMSESAKLHVGKKNNFYGKKHTAESGLKMSESRMENKNCVGRKYSPETIEKMKASARARWAHQVGG